MGTDRYFISWIVMNARYMLNRAELEGTYWIRADGAGLVELRLFRGAHQRGERRYASLQHRFRHSVKGLTPSNTEILRGRCAVDRRDR